MANIAYIQPRGGNEYHDEPPPESGDADVSLRHLFNTLWRRKSIIIATVLLICTVSALSVLQAVPLYVAEALVVVETRREKVVDIESVLQGVNPDFYTNETEAAVIRSRALAGKVVDQLGLVNHPLFNPYLAEPREGLLSRITGYIDPRTLWRQWKPAWVADVMSEIRGAPPRPPRAARTPEEQAAALRETVISVFLSGLYVSAGERSRVIGISYTSEDPEVSALIANTLADTYILESINAKFEATARASDWLHERVAELRGRVEESSQALEAYRREVGIVDLRNQATLLTQQLTELNSKLIMVRSERAEAQARYEQVRRLLDSREDIASAAAVLQSPLIQRLREQEATVAREVAELRTQVLDRHPNMVLKRSELEDLQGRIQAEIGKIAENLKNEAEIAEIRQRNLAIEVESLRQQIAEQNDSEVKLRALESDANANRQLYETILARFKETGVQEQGLQQADARLISPATAPRNPSYPRKSLVMALAFIGATMIGVLLVFIIEHLDSGFRSLRQVEALLGLPAIGVLPKLGRWVREQPQDFVLAKPNSVYGEAIRSIRTSLLLSNVDAPPKTVLVTSSLPGEGKSSTALALARAAARGGQRTLILDCDLRHPSLHIGLGVANLVGVVDVLSGRARLEEVLEIDERSGCHYLCAGSSVPNPADLLGSEAMRRMVARLREVYDLVVIDTPPVLAVSDALLLMRLMDKTVFLVRWGKTPREAAQLGIRQVLDASADLAGVVLSQVDMRAQARYGYGDSAAYYGSYKKYYVE